jgi:SAM-dependent methyltransferase
MEQLIGRAPRRSTRRSGLSQIPDHEVRYLLHKLLCSFVDEDVWSPTATDTPPCVRTPFAPHAHVARGNTCSVGPWATSSLGMGPPTNPVRFNSFDYVFCVDSFHHYPHPKRALSEIHRVLKPGGQVVLADPTAPLPIRGLLNSLVRFLRMGDVRLYDERWLTRLFDSCRLQPIDWRAVGSWGFVASARAL